MIDIKKEWDSQKTVFIIDGSSFLYRAYYSLPPMHTKTGVPVSAVFGFCRMLKKLINAYLPHHMVLAWDTYSEKGDVREQLYEAYKANRQEPPSELREQKKLIQEFAPIINLCQAMVPGAEADDLMYSLTQDYVKIGYNVVLVTSDKDMGQNVGDCVVLFDPFKDVVYDAEALEKRYGVSARKLVFYFSLIGDAVDNIPGVKGIGPKTAQELVHQFESLEDLYARLDQVAKPRTRELLAASRENAFLSKELFTARYYDLQIPVSQTAFDSKHWYNARDFFIRLNFSSLLKEFPPVSEAQKALGKEIGARFITVQSREDLQALVAHIRAAGTVAIDTETDSLESLRATCVGISLCVEKGTAYYIPLAHVTNEPQLPASEVRELLRPVLEDPAIKKYLHHAKFDRRVLHGFGLELQGVAFDTLIAVHLVAKDWQNLNLKDVSEFYLHQPMLTYDEMVTAHKLKNFAHVPLDRATEYAAADAHQTFSLVPVLKEELKKHEQERLFYDIEMPLSELLYYMEIEGIVLDAGVLTELAKSTELAIAALEREIRSLLPPMTYEVNLNSPKQLEQVLFVELNLPPVKKTGKKTGYSTDQEVLQELAKIHPVPGLIMHHRELAKIKGTYLEALPTYINERTQRVHTSFSQTKTATGRLASSDPNLQNIPTGIANMPIRSAFTAREGHFFISADYSQIELRVLAYLSQDEALKEAFLRGRDIHTNTAVGLFGVSAQEVTPAQRALAKQINFSIIYGVSAYGLSKDLGISYKEAEAYIERYFAQYPGVTAWMENVIRETKEHGYVTTLWGRRRQVLGIYERNKTMYDAAQRVAINTKVQGTAAELMKIGMLACDRVVREQFSEVQLLLQIHDELLISAPFTQCAVVAERMRTTLETIVAWNVPLVVTTRVGATWQDVTK